MLRHVADSGVVEVLVRPERRRNKVMPIQDPKRHMTPQVVATRLGKSRRFVVDLIHKKELVAYDMRSPGSSVPRWMIDWDDVVEWMKSRRNTVRREDKQTAQVQSQTTRKRSSGIKYDDLL